MNISISNIYPYVNFRSQKKAKLELYFTGFATRQMIRETPKQIFFPRRRLGSTNPMYTIVISVLETVEDSLYYSALTKTAVYRH